MTSHLESQDLKGGVQEFQVDKGYEQGAGWVEGGVYLKRAKGKKRVDAV